MIPVRALYGPVQARAAHSVDRAPLAFGTVYGPIRRPYGRMASGRDDSAAVYGLVHRRPLDHCLVPIREQMENRYQMASILFMFRSRVTPSASSSSHRSQSEFIGSSTTVVIALWPSAHVDRLMPGEFAPGQMGRRRRERNHGAGCRRSDRTRMPPRCSGISGRKWTRYSGKGGDSTKTLAIGIASYDRMKARTLGG